MKLKCDKHNRRVLSGSTSFLHRTGDMSPCDGKTAVMTDNTLNTTRTYKIDNDGDLVQLSTTKG